jgi:cystathionine beta-lyase
MDESQKGASVVAEWLKRQGRVKEVFYPGLADHPGFSIHKDQSEGPGAVLSFTLESVELTERVLENMKLAAFAVSLGGVESIISYPVKMSHAAMPRGEREARGITDTLVRLSVGLEEIDDLIEDLDRVING